MARNPRWERDELILALDLYLRIGKGDDKDPEVIKLSRELNLLPLDLARPDPERFRNPNGVAMKLANFAALDPKNQGVALTRGGRRDREVWHEFDGDRSSVERAATAIRARLADTITATRPIRYWAFAANPRVYRIEEAVQALAIDRWTTKGKDIRAGGGSDSETNAPVLEEDRAKGGQFGGLPCGPDSSKEASGMARPELLMVEV